MMGKKICLDLGCGRDKKEASYYGIDCAKIHGIDIIYNLDLKNGAKLPFADDSIDKIYTRHFLEHIQDPLAVIEEIHRILKKDGEVEIIVPHWSWYGSHTFMHNKYFHSKDFEFFDKNNPYNYYTKVAFKIISTEIVYSKGSRRWWSKPFSQMIRKILNINHLYSEQFLVSFLMPEEIRIVMKKDKPCESHEK